MAKPGQGGQNPILRFVDQNELYGAHIMRDFARGLTDIRTAVDLGPGAGRDLAILKQAHPTAATIGLEACLEFAKGLEGKGHEVRILDLERDVFPFADSSVDVFVANQLLEHMKETFWVFHEVARCLRIGGAFLIGVPNVLAFHNRMLALLGRHPTQYKLSGPHVRPFSIPDMKQFLATCWPGGFAVEAVAGAQFYPLPTALARPITRLAPGLAFSIFFKLRKMAAYDGEFLDYPPRNKLQTNFYLGGRTSEFHQAAE